MTMMNDIEFDRAIYEQQGHVSGAYPPEREEHYAKIRSLLKGADAALYRQPGYFFDTLDTDPPTFAFGFLVRSEIREEGFFDIYLAPVDEVAGVSLVDLKDRLETQSSGLDTRHDQISETVAVSVANATRHGSNSTDRGGNRNGGSGPAGADGTTTDATGPTDGGSDWGSNWETVDSENSWGSNDDRGADSSGDTAPSHSGGAGIYATPMSLGEVATVWERYRSGDDPVGTDLAELNRFVATVSGALAEIDFVSHVPDRGDPRYFSFAGWNRETGVDRTELLTWLEDNVTLEGLNWDELPTYEDELRRLRSSMVDDVSNVGEYEQVSTQLASSLETVIEENLASYHREQATDVFRAAADGSLDVDDDGGGRLDGIRSIVGSGSDANSDRQYEAVATGVSTDAVDDELKSAIASELGESVRADLQERVESDIVPALASRLDSAVETQVETVLKRTIEHVDEFRGSKPYGEANSK